MKDQVPVKPCVSEVAEIADYPLITPMSPRIPLVFNANHIWRVAIADDANV